MEKTQEKTLYEAFVSGAEINPRAPAFLYKGKTVSYSKFVENVDRLAAALTAFGIQSGDIITASLPNIPKAAYLVYAANKVGAVLYLQHVLNAPEITVSGLKKTNSRILFVLDSAAAALKDACAEMNVKLISCCPADELGSLITHFYRRRERLAPPCNATITDYNHFVACTAVDSADTSRTERLSPEKAAILLDSGGTEGLPKTVELSANALNALCYAGAHLINSKNGYSYRYMLSPLPIFHCFGLAMGLHAMVLHGGCNVFMPRFSRKDALRYLKKNKINYMLGVPAVYEALLSCPPFCGKKLKAVDVAFCGGDSLSPKTKEEFDRRMADAGARCRLMEGYGLSETLSVCCANTHAQNRAGSVGKPVLGAQVRAFDKELCVSGETLMNGYYGDAAATDKVFFTDNQNTRWLKTGDLGHVDSDGFVYFGGRAKNIIKVSGESVFPIEIETIAKGVPHVKACAAFAVPDPKSGSRVALAVEPESGTSRETLLDALTRALSSSLQKNALPKFIEFYDELPKTKMLKIDVEKLKAEFGEIADKM
ncbi:MAG: acyl--CoA ligase [Firmicutes bacterium]|nr:acyl--CoA ligase [Bacillota bacterium]